MPVSNTTPIVYLVKIKKLNLLEHVYRRVYICSAVWQDIYNSTDFSCIRRRASGQNVTFLGFFNLDSQPSSTKESLADASKDPRSRISFSISSFLFWRFPRQEKTARTFNLIKKLLVRIKNCRYRSILTCYMHI